MKDFPAIAEQYARDVMAGRILSCRYVKLACQKHLDGLAHQKSEDYPYYLDEKAAAKVCRFTELMPHVKGKWARDKERIQVQEWWAFILVNVFGWKRKKDNLRRYRRVYIEVPRKNAKSTGTAALCNYMLTADDEHGAEVYSGATTEKQAWEVFGPARLMAMKTPEMLEAYGVQVGARNLNVVDTASKMEPIIGKPGDGASPSFSVTDEFHEHPTSEQYDTMVTGMGSREQPIAWAITTAGSDTAGPCYALRDQLVAVLQGQVDLPDLFGIIYTIDLPDPANNQTGVDWTSEDALRMANPNMGVSVFEDYLRSQQQKAVADPREQSIFKTKHLNIWVGAAAPYFNLEKWNQLADPGLKESDFYGEPCFVGLDLASKLDICASVRVFVRDVDGLPHWYVFPRLYVPQARAEHPECRHYMGWVEQGHLIATPGDITDYDYIEADLKADSEKHSIAQLGADPYNATQLLTHLQGWLGVDNVVEVPQTVTHLSEPMKEVQARIVAGRIHHAGNPCMSWMIGNVTAQEDRNQNVFPRKERVDKKIDGPVALIIGGGRALKYAGPVKYELLFVG